MGNLVLFLKNFKSFCPATGRDRGVCPGIFAPALVPGQRDVPSRFVPGRPVPLKHYRKVASSNPFRFVTRLVYIHTQNDNFLIRSQSQM